MKKIFTTAALTISVFAIGQPYTKGNLQTATLGTLGTDDINTCQSYVTRFIDVKKHNSFLNDTIKIKDQGGQIVGQFINSFLSPADTLFEPNFGQIGLPLISVGHCNISMLPQVPFKVISGLDTLYFVGGWNTNEPINPANYYYTPTTPCSYSSNQQASGKIYIDNNSNCIYDSGDSLVNLGYSNNSPIISITNGLGGFFGNGLNTSNSLFTSVLGHGINYQLNDCIPTNFSSLTGSIQLPPITSFIFPFSSCQTVTTYTLNNSSFPIDTLDFALQCSSNRDVYSWLGTQSQLHPAAPVYYIYPFVGNSGCTTASGTLTLIKSPLCTYDATLTTNPPSYISANGDTLMWTYNNLTNIGNGTGYWNSFSSAVAVHPSTSLQIGDTLCFKLTSTVPSGDLDVNNNTYYTCVPVVTAYDPNYVEVSPKGTGAQGCIPSSADELTYTIHFQNTGTATAYNINVADSIDADLDPKSIRILSSSHAMSPELISNQLVKFNFNYIQLPDSNSNEPKSHGFVTYKIKLKSGLAVNSQIKNKAYIYFDFNAPVGTNTALNTLCPSSVGLNEIVSNQLFNLYPNPASEALTININMINENTTISIIDILGKTVKQINTTNYKTEINISDISNGIYFIKLEQGKNTSVEKIIVSR